ncbi:MAG: endonuclease III, partial [Deltaproteobacteria bacterium CG07_land_8_20_14_0_80_38_7]
MLAILKKTFPDVKPALNFKTALQSLIATILSAQCTDLQVNKVTPVLFKRFKTAKDFANADQTEIESIIRSTGFFKNKTSSIKKACA